MKSTHILVPVLALAAVVAWNVAARRSVHTLEGEVEAWQDALAAGRGVGETEVARQAGSSKPSRGPVDWRQAARQLADLDDGGDGAANLKAVADLQDRIAAMDADELTAALDQIQSLGLDDAERALLEEALIEPLIEQTPEVVLDRFASRIGNEEDGVAWQLPFAMASWAKKDPAAAAAWMDRQIAAGVFESKSLDGRSQERLEFEGALLSGLLGDAGPDAAGRIAALPEDQRREALEQIPFTELNPAARAAYAELVRSLVPSDERDGSFTHVASQVAPEEGYDGVDSFLDAIRATPGERQVVAREAANATLSGIASERTVTRGDVDAMRAWVEQQAPGTADKVTGEALGDAAQEDGDFGFEEASKLALEYHRQSGNDDLLAAFLDSFAARSNLKTALPLVREIRDPRRREAILELLE